MQSFFHRLLTSALALLLLSTTIGSQIAAAAPAAQGESPVTTSAQSGCSVVIVQRGDTLSSIARRCGNTSVQAIMAANGLRSATIYVGQRLIIPSTTTPPPTNTTYVVQRGDTLSSVARRFGISVQAIMAANGLRSTTIYVGQRLIISGSTTPPPPTNTTYVVQRGDTLTSIAGRFGTTVQAIMGANGMGSTSIYVGQRLVIPGPGGRPRPSGLTVWPSSGPSGTLVDLHAVGFPAGATVAVYGGPTNSEYTEVIRGQTDANGAFYVRTPVPGVAGQQWIFRIITDGAEAVATPFTITR